MRVLLAYVARPTARNKILWVITPTSLEWHYVVHLISCITAVSARVTITLQDAKPNLLPPAISSALLSH